MIKKNKWQLIISSILILLPIVFGLILWNDLPEQMATHWGTDGNVDGWSNRLYAILVFPVLILIVHWFCILFTALDPKNKDQNNKIFSVVLWTCPTVSLFANGLIYATAFDAELKMDLIGLLMIGLMFVLIGNYLPKCKQNHTIGIKVKWTLENEENWNATHRLTGKLWVIGGLMMMACIFLPEEMIPWILVIFLLVLAVIPITYSYLYYKKQRETGTTATGSSHVNKSSRIRKVTSIALLIITLLLVGIFMFTGEIDVIYGDTSFQLDASFWKDLTVEYAAVDSIEYREQDDVGSRTNGLGSARLLAGAFRNDEFGNYTRYSYIKVKACIVLTVDGKTLVINGIDEAATKDIYYSLLEKIS